MTLEERVAAARAAKGTKAVPTVTLEDRVKAVQEAKPLHQVAEGVASAAAPEAVAPARKPRAPRDPDTIASGLGRAVDKMQAAFGGTVEAIGEATGSDYLVESGKEIREANLKQAEAFGTPTAPQSYEQVNWTDPSSVGDYMGEMFKGSLPSMGVVLGGAGAGQMAGAPFGGIGRAVGGAIGGLLGGMGINIGEVQNQIKATDPDAKSPWHSILAGTAMSSLDAVGAGVLLKPLVKVWGKEIVYDQLVKQGLAKAVALDIVKGAGTEAAIGAAQGVLQSTAAQSGAGKDIDWDEVGHDTINSAIGGALLGGSIRAATGAAGRLVERGHLDGEAFQSAVTEADTKRQGVLGKAWSTFGGRSTDMLRGLGEAAPEVKDFVRNFNTDESGKTASKKTIFEDADLLANNWRTRWEEATAGKSKEQLAEMFDDLSQDHGGKTGANAKARAVLDDVYNEAKKRNLDDINYVKGHLPVRVDVAKLKANREQVINDFTPHYASRDAAAKAVDDYINMVDNQIDPNMAPKINRLVTETTTPGELEVMARFRKDPNNPDSMKYRFAQGSTTPEFGHLEKTRAFGNVPQAKLNKYVKEQSAKEKDEAVKDYFEGAAHRLAFSDRFGAKGELANAQIAKGILQAQKAGRPVPKIEVDRMYDLLDAYNGLHNQVKDSRVRAIQSTVAAGLTMKTLPLAALSSFTEFVTPAIRGDVSAAMMATVPTFIQIAKDAARVLLKNTHRTEFSRIASEVGITLDAATSVAAERLGANVFSRGAAKTMRGFFLVNGLSAVTHFNRIYSAQTADYIMKRNLRELTAGLSITSPKGKYYANQLRSMGVDVNTNLDAVTLYSPSNPSQVLAANNARRLGIKRFVDQTVLEPNLGSTPLWMNEGRMQLFAMLKRYPAAFGNTILPQLGRKVMPDYTGSYTRSAGALVGAGFTVGMMMAIGFLQDELKQIAKNGEIDYPENRTELQRTMDVANAVGTPLQMSLLTDAFAANRYGASPLETVVGPVAGLAKETVTAGQKTIGSFMNGDPELGYIAKYLWDQTPTRFFKPVKDELKDSLGLE